MKTPLPVVLLSRLIECLLNRELGETVAGDLNEEFALRAHDASPPRATFWFAGQVLRSVPQLLWLSARRWSSLKAVAVAAIAYYVLGRVEPYMHGLVGLMVDPGLRMQMVLDLGIGFTACACGGFLSTWVHRGSAALYSLIGTGMLALAIARANPDLPTWFLTAFLFVAFVAPIVGGVVLVSIARIEASRRSGKGGP